MHISMLSWGRRRLGISRRLLGTFDHFSGLCNTILLKLSDCFNDPQMHCSRAFEQKISAKLKCRSYAWPPPSLTGA